MINIPLKPENELFTDQQWQAIFDGEDNLLVSASAGSGKTTVLVRRVIEKLQSGTNIDELLIVTFTEAAAREMKERLQVALQKAVNQEVDPERQQHFTKQLILLPNAHISTLHAFCLSVIRRFYYLIDLDPVFRMLTDETETLLLKEDVWQTLRDENYEAQNEAFYRLAQNFSNDRSDEGLTSLIMALATFAMANPQPIVWLENLAKNYDTTGGIGENGLYQSQIQPLILSSLTTAHHQLTQAVALAQDPLMEKALDVVSSDLSQVEALQAVFVQDDIEQAYQLFMNLSFMRYPTYRKEEAKELSQRIKPLRDSAKTLIDSIGDFFAYEPAEMLRLMDEAAPLVAEMARVTEQFIARYRERKQEKGLLDFNDLEHLTLAILRGEGTGSEASTYYRTKFSEILVDEYQDVNRLQEALLYWLRQVDGQGNMFMVGDVKQSIYAFRLADPTLFIEKYLAFAKEQDGRRIVLAENFRSRAEVLHFTNLIFEQLMDERVGQIPYDESAKLVPGFPNFPDSEAFQPEILLFEKGTQQSESTIDDKTTGELHMVGLKIREMIDQKFHIYDKQLKAERPITYNDIVLLTPTRKNNLTIIDVFKQLDIPLEVSDAQNYFQATEIQTMIALLQIIDNPYQDIPLAAVLRSPIVGLHEGELAQIRLCQPQGDFYEAFLAAQEATLPFSEKLQTFHQQLQAWREMARRQPIAELLWDIYEQSAYLDFVLGLPSGRQRYANLIALVNRAESYERSSFRGLYQFIRFIEKMQEKDKDLAEPLAIPVEDAVRVMTIHASKGLEFPVVFLLDLTKQFNSQDFKARYIFEEQLGAGIQYISDEHVKYDTLPYQAIKQVRLQKALSEEMRKLYVALTRAEQKLFLVGSYKTQEEAYKAWKIVLTQEEVLLEPALRLSSRSSLMHWIGMTLMRHPKMTTYVDDAKDKRKTINHAGDFTLSWWDEARIQAGLQHLPQTAKQALPTEVIPTAVSVDELMPQLQFTYNLEKSTMTTNYQSVSEIKRIFNDPDEQVIHQLDWESLAEKEQKQQFRYVSDALAKPKFLEEVQVEATMVGSATHLLLQMMPLNSQPTLATLQELVTQLVAAQTLTEAVATRIDLAQILWFFETALGQEILANATRVKREQPFSMLKDARTIFKDFDEAGAELLIHGIIDGYIEYDDHIVLYDFKTDYLVGEQAEQQARERYLGQLRLYKEALQEALQKPVTQTALILLRSQTIFEIK